MKEKHCRVSLTCNCSPKQEPLETAELTVLGKIKKKNEREHVDCREGCSLEKKKKGALRIGMASEKVKARQ